MFIHSAHGSPGRGSTGSIRSSLSFAKLAPIVVAIGALIASHVAYGADPNSIACSINANPQAPRNIAAIVTGTNKAPIKNADTGGPLNVCNIHFHSNAEHKVADSKLLSIVDASPGFVCKRKDAGPVKAAKGHATGHADCASVAVGDTIEVHWVFTSCKSPDKPASPKLGNCTQCDNPVLRVHAKVFLITDDNDKDGLDFANYAEATGQAKPFSVKALPTDKGAVEYVGSTTGGDYDSEKQCSPYTANWIVQRECAPLKVSSLKAWCSANIFKETVVHDVRTLVTKPELLSAAKVK